MQEVSAPELSIGIIRRAIAFPFAHFGTLLKIALGPWLIAYALLYGLAFYYTAGNIADFSPVVVKKSFEGNITAQILLILVDAFVVTIIAVGIHRVIIRHEKPSWTIVHFGRNEIAYMVVSVLLFALFMFPQYVIIIIQYFLEPDSVKNITPQVILLRHPLTVTAISPDAAGLLQFYTLISFVFAYFSITLSMAFPHAAVAGKISLRYAWSVIGKYILKFYWLLIVFGLTLAIIALPVYLPVFWLKYKLIFFDIPNLYIVEYIVSALGYLSPISAVLLLSMKVAFISYFYLGLTSGIDAQQQVAESS